MPRPEHWRIPWRRGWQAIHPQPRTPLAARILERWSGAWLEVLASSLGAALAWVLARQLFGHQQPIFAAMSAVICLAPGLPNHTRQTMGVLIGVATGISIGELSLLLPGDSLMLRLALASFLSMMVAVSYGHTPVVPIQAGISAILVVAFGPAAAGSMRMVDVLVGATVGLLFSHILMTVERTRGD